jgi:hypothetical protein
MTNKSEWLPERRGWTAKQTAHYIGMSDAWLSQNKADLVKKYGFPIPSPATGLYDGKKVGLWYDQHSGILPKDASVDATNSWRQGLEALADDHSKPAAA